MTRTLAALCAAALLGLPGCSKGPGPTTGSGAFRLKDPVWVTYGWSRNRMAYVIYFVPSTTAAFNAEGLVATIKSTKEGDLFEGALDGYPEKSKWPFKAEPRKGETLLDNRPFRNGVVFLVNVGTPCRVQQVQGIAFSPSPKEPEEWPAFAEAEVKRLAKEHPKIGEFPKEPAPESKTKKK